MNNLEQLTKNYETSEVKKSMDKVMEGINPKSNSWEEELNEKINYIIQAGFELADEETEDMLKSFISQNFIARKDLLEEIDKLSFEGEDGEPCILIRDLEQLIKID